MSNSSVAPFVKWAGGKRQLIPQIKERMPEKYNNYYEPFVGGGAVTFELLPANALINDINKALINAYKQICNAPKVFMKAVNKLDEEMWEDGKEYYYSLREHYNDKLMKAEYDVELAALFVFINKHCFNGLYRVNGKGLFNVPYNNSRRTSVDEEAIMSTSKYLQGVTIIDGDFEVACKDAKKGDFVFLVGPSGAGKSTFIKLILKEIDADEGTITACGYEVTSLSNREIPLFRRKVGTVFQDFRLLPKKTVFENVAFAMEVLHKTPRQIRKQVPQILSLVGISDKAHKYPDELSAGEQQRVAIARAIVNNPTVLIADEPTGNLDPNTAWEIMDLLEQINLRGTTIVMVTHAKDIVDRMKKRVIAIERGKIVRDEEGQYGYKEDTYFAE